VFWIQLLSFKQKIKNKNDLRKQSLIDQEWHLALEVSTSEMAHDGREREHTYKTTTRQSLGN
jgi:dimeric dUTPase (all-alpha-NTP-PPase superfamily)